MEKKKKKHPCEGCIWTLWAGEGKIVCSLPMCRREEYRRLWMKPRSGNDGEKTAGS